MPYIAAIAVIGILVLQASGAIPLSSVGGPMVIGLAFFAAALAVAIHEAWTARRGIVGWIVNIVVAFIGVLVAATVGGPVVGLVVGFANPGQTLAAAGGLSFAVALALMMGVTLFGAWGLLRLVRGGR